MARILVSGDAITHINIFLGARKNFADASPGTRSVPEPGGAQISARLLEQLVAGEGKLEVVNACPPAGSESFHVWELVEFKKKEQKLKAWRIRDSLGFGDGRPDAKTGPIPKTGKSAEVAFLDDRALDFRRNPSLWPALLAEGSRQKKPTWIICATGAPLLNGRLWYELRDKFSKQLVLVASVQDFRRNESLISQGRSWEQTVQDICRELDDNPALEDLARCRHLFLRLDNEGVLWFDNGPGRPTRTLIFDPSRLEGDWSGHISGGVHGLSSCLPAALSRAAALNPGSPDFASACVLALNAQRTLLEIGYGDNPAAPEFPFEALASSLAEQLKKETFRVNRIPPSMPREGHPWSMVEGQASGKSVPLFARARQVAIKGTGSLSGIPFAEFGKLFTVDRNELESYNGIRALIRNYRDEKKAKKPLCLGVFGPPGAGKSFGIKEVAKGILGEKVPILEFNLSQFPEPGMPIAALHQVRDQVVRGQLPVVFWDEFDSHSLAWLQYLLAPMQDGSFMDGEVVHPLGKCIFIFAGGTAYTMSNFTPDRESQPEKFAAFKSLKGPDFVSRLRGYLNVLGPNRRLIDDPEMPGVLKPDPEDRGFPIRRALLIRVMAEVFGNARLIIDPGLLNALLRVSEYRHGARSLETIINLISCAGSRKLIRANIPPREQMELHVDYDEFMTLVQEDQAFLAMGKAQAPAFHDYFRALCRKNNWPIAFDKPFKQLPAMIQEDNVAAVMRIPRVLSLVGLKVVKAGKAKPGADEDVLAVIRDNMEELAEAEHDGWMETRLANGWVPGKNRSNDDLVHNLLVPYEKLSREAQLKDHENVGRYPEIVAKAGFRIVKEE